MTTAIKQDIIRFDVTGDISRARAYEGEIKKLTDGCNRTCGPLQLPGLSQQYRNG